MSLWMLDGKRLLLLTWLGPWVFLADSYGKNNQGECDDSLDGLQVGDSERPLNGREEVIGSAMGSWEIEG